MSGNAFRILVAAVGMTAQISAQVQPGSRNVEGEGVISGNVVAIDDGGQVPMAKVTLIARDFPGNWEMTTGSDGRFVFRALRPGRYSLQANHPAYLTASYGQKYVGQIGRFIEVAAGSTIDADLRFVRGGVITGRIVDVQGRPVPDISVQAMQLINVGRRQRLMPIAARSYSSNDQGVYRVTGLPPGEFYVSATYRVPAVNPIAGEAAGLGYAPTWYPGVPSISLAQKVKAQAGQETFAGDLQLVQTNLVELTGKVKRAQDGGYAAASVRLVSRDGLEGVPSSILPANVDRQGNFSIRPVAPGEYRIVAYTIQQTYAHRDGGNLMQVASTSTVSEMEFGSLDIDVRGENVSGLTVLLTPGTRVSGRIETDTAWNHRPIQVGPYSTNPTTDFGGGGRAVRPEPDGRFELRLPPGKRLLVARGLPDGWFTESIVLDGRDVTTSGLDVGESDIRGVVIRVSSQSGEVNGTVERPHSTRDYSVVVLSKNPDRRSPQLGGAQIARPDQQGRFRLRGLRPGEYFVTAVGFVTPEDIYDPDYWRQMEASPATVEVRLEKAGIKTLTLKVAPDR